jgi:excisionase family DNA binding protein
MTLFSVTEVAKVVGLSERGVRELVRCGVVKAHKISGRHVFDVRTGGMTKKLNDFKMLRDVPG